jgi:hypothetical protein
MDADGLLTRFEGSRLFSAICSCALQNPHLISKHEGGVYCYEIVLASHLTRVFQSMSLRCEHFGGDLYKVKYKRVLCGLHIPRTNA